MKTLGVDWGERKTGVAICEGKLAEPLLVIKVDRSEELVKKIQKIAIENGIEKVIVGVSEGEMGMRQRAFGKKLETEIGLPVEFADETLSTQDAQRMSIEAGKGRKKRREMEDAYAAAVLLQAWVDENL